MPGVKSAIEYGIMGTDLLRIEHLTKNFGGILAVNDLNISVGKGEIVAIIGPNGSGKTTLFNLIVHLYDSDGRQDLFRRSASRLTRLATHAINALGVARTFQTLRLFPNLTVVENVLVGMSARLRWWPVDAVIQHPTHPARGERSGSGSARTAVPVRAPLNQHVQRARQHRCPMPTGVGSRSLAHSHRGQHLLLLDEPAAGMNPSETREIMEDIADIHDRGCTILLIEHDMGLVEGLAHRVIAIDHGTKIAEGSYRGGLRKPGGHQGLSRAAARRRKLGGTDASNKPRKVTMKIAKAETILLSMPFEAGGTPPWSFGGKPANSFDVLLVRLETDNGLVGWGEAFSRGRDVALKQTIDTRLLPLIIGRDASQISKIKHDLEFQLHNFGRIGGIKYGIAAIDIALWDLLGKSCGQPLCRLLGGAFADELEVYASLMRYGNVERRDQGHASGDRARLPLHQAARDRAR